MTFLIIAKGRLCKKLNDFSNYCQRESMQKTE